MEILIVTEPVMHQQTPATIVERSLLTKLVPHEVYVAQSQGDVRLRFSYDTTTVHVRFGGSRGTHP